MSRRRIQQVIYVPNLKKFTLIYKARIGNIEFDLLLAVNYVKVTKFQIDISKHVEKSPENSDGRTDIREGV